MNQPVQIFICDDHEMHLEGTSLLLKDKEGVQVTGMASTGSMLLQKLPGTACDILLLDVNLPDYKPEQLLPEIRKLAPALKIIYLTMMRGTRNVHKLISKNIQGYILKSAPVHELLGAIKTVATGGTYFSEEINILTEENDHRNTISLDDNKVNEILTKREVEILKLICSEFSNSEIAARLFISVGTVDTHRKNIMGKLGVNNTVGMVRFALKNNLLD
ncbi:MAG: response regulator transcription factor [Ferruginibacter sp.]|nr:response regulator transcription factor [Ferruginibacter sp.]